MGLFIVHQYQVLPSYSQNGYHVQIVLQVKDIYSKCVYRLHGLVTARQMDKQTISQLERRLQEERRLRNSCEAQLAAERKAKKAEEAAAARAVAMAAAANK
jgi:hypothetical protein